ncbi:bacteriohemerythrin [Sideroxyarcus emersonii]|uniref:Bacteriohemerythrin n=1 Tax=Sideroxyarcus emersonii TaxID=2764705 RepID=A0AAN1X866_9PROT|nr:hemerythrin domain-containing protein [Sideroxyarcus emersonii]BCK86521.1 bacteriohemerythrin [Sideroxyarcus emersonii]
MSGVAEIERQHHELVGMLNKLNDAAKHDKPLEMVEHLIDEVIAYTSFHFAAEEHIMEQSGYAEIEAHKEKHRQLLHDALKFKEKLRYIGEHEFVDWFNHWPFAKIHAHIVYADRQVEDHIAQHGLNN